MTKSTGTGLMNRVMLALSEQGHFVDRYQVGLFRAYDDPKRIIKVGTVGVSDLIGFRKGDCRAFYLEIKDGTGRPTKEQKLFIAAMRERGAIAASVRSVEEALKLIATA